MDEKERIEFLIKEKKLSNVEFSSITGVAPATISHITSGRSKPTLSILKCILRGFPELSTEWLFLGEGPMYSADIPTYIEQGGYESGETPDLFSSLPTDERPVVAPSRVARSIASSSRQLDDNGLKDVVRETMFAALERQKRQIVEVRIFFDDGTYEAFETKKS